MDPTQPVGLAHGGLPGTEDLTAAQDAASLHHGTDGLNLAPESEASVPLLEMAGADWNRAVEYEDDANDVDVPLLNVTGDRDLGRGNNTNDDTLARWLVQTLARWQWRLPLFVALVSASFVLGPWVWSWFGLVVFPLLAGWAFIHGVIVSRRSKTGLFAFWFPAMRVVRSSNATRSQSWFVRGTPETNPSFVDRPSLLVSAFALLFLASILIPLIYFTPRPRGAPRPTVAELTRGHYPFYEVPRTLPSLTTAFNLVAVGTIALLGLRTPSPKVTQEWLGNVRSLSASAAQLRERTLTAATIARPWYRWVFPVVMSLAIASVSVAGRVVAIYLCNFSDGLHIMTFPQEKIFELFWTPLRYAVLISTTAVASALGLLLFLWLTVVRVDELLSLCRSRLETLTLSLADGMTSRLDQAATTQECITLLEDWRQCRRTIIVVDNQLIMSDITAVITALLLCFVYATIPFVIGVVGVAKDVPIVDNGTFCFLGPPKDYHGPIPHHGQDSSGFDLVLAFQVASLFFLVGIAAALPVAKIVFLHDITTKQERLLSSFRRRVLCGAQWSVQVQGQLRLDAYISALCAELTDASSDEVPTVFGIRLSYNYSVALKGLLLSGSLSLVGVIASHIDMGK
eukprot:m.56394 g.56394  ORF g.56394 m.56394 type:complete len:627 (-) comp16967_c0_seq3:293-2173(-)